MQYDAGRKCETQDILADQGPRRADPSDIPWATPFSRTRFTHKKSGKTAYLLDQMLGLSAHTRLSADAKASILKEAAQSSYQKAGECLPESVSRETVMRAVHKLKISKPEKPVVEEKRKVKTLYVEADEDHIALQFHEKKGM